MKAQQSRSILFHSTARERHGMSPPEKLSQDEAGVAEGDARVSVVEDGDRAGPPKWLDVTFMNEALRNAGVDAVVDRLEIKYAVPRGDNFCSCIFRVTTYIRGESKPRSLLVKCPPEGETFIKLLEEQKFFQKESFMLTTGIARIRDTFHKLAPGKEVPPLAAKCLYHAKEPPRFLVLEDLKEQNFYLGDRRKGLNMNQATVALEALGQFHATTHVILKQEPDFFDTMINPFVNGGMGTEAEYQESVDTISKAIGEWSPLYSEKLLKLKKNFFRELEVINSFRPGKFNVLVHGDFWVNNMMFRDNDEGKTVDIRFLDLQMCHVTNPAVDLILFRYTSLQEDILLNNWDELLKIYLDSLNTTLDLIGEPPLSMDQIDELFEEALHFTFLAVLTWLPLVRMVKGKFDVEKAVTEGPASQSAMYYTPEFTHWMKTLLPYIDEQGCFDSL